MSVVLILVLLLAVFQVTVLDNLVNNPDFYQLDAYTWESDDFRSMQLGELIASRGSVDYDMLTTLMIRHEYDLSSLQDTSYENVRLLERRQADYRKLRKAYETLFMDLKYFPIPKSTRAGTPEVTYANGWMDTRTYGGERGHEGCDIMGMERERGFYPVISMTDGVIEKIGWLEKGGWRIGVRSPSGLYLYYAHLYQYSQEWQEGDVVKAGELLGFMGDSGYGTEEGTVGNFDVHLHLGLYLKTDHYEELSINPYWVLRYLEKYRLKYQY